MSTAAHTTPLAAARILRRRKLVGRLVEVSAAAAALVAVAVLVLVVGGVVVRGAGAINLDLLTHTPAPFGQRGGGIANAIVGTLVLVGVAALMALPVGVLAAVYLNELASPRVARVLRLLTDVLAGVPTIVVGIFVFGLLVAGNGQSGLAGSFALAVIMLPIVVRGSEGVLRAVPATLREAGLALGVPHWRVVLRVVLPSAARGIVTASVLAIARAAGETAPLLFTSSIAANAVVTDARQPLASLPVSIFVDSQSPSPQDHQRAWAAALLLILIVLVTSLAARALASHGLKALIARRRARRTPRSPHPSGDGG